MRLSTIPWSFIFAEKFIMFKSKDFSAHFESRQQNNSKVGF